MTEQIRRFLCSCGKPCKYVHINIDAERRFARDEAIDLISQLMFAEYRELFADDVVRYERYEGVQTDSSITIRDCTAEVYVGYNNIAAKYIEMWLTGCKIDFQLMKLIGELESNWEIESTFDDIASRDAALELFIFLTNVYIDG